MKEGRPFECIIVEVDDGSTRRTPWCQERKFVDMDLEINRLSGNRPLLRVRAWGKERPVGK